MKWNLAALERVRSLVSRSGSPKRLTRYERARVERLEDRTLMAVSAAPDRFGLFENRPLDIGGSGLLANDATSSGGPLAVTSFTQPANGSLVVNPDGSFRYFPAANFYGVDHFTYTLGDGTGDTDSATVRLDVTIPTPLATVSAGSPLGSVDSSRGALLDAVTSSLLDSPVGLGVTDWNSLAGGEINLARLLESLQADLGVAGTGEALAADATLVQILNAGAAAAQADGDTALVVALNAQAAQVGGLTGTIRLGDLLQIDPAAGSLADVDLNALDLVTGLFQRYNFDNGSTTPTPVTIPGTALIAPGLQATIGSLGLSARVVEPPVFVRGAEGTRFHTAAIRLKLDLNDLVGVDPDVSSLEFPISQMLGLPPNLVTANLNISDLQVYVEVARTEGAIETIDALSGAVGVRAEPGVSNVYIGTFDDSVFFDRGHIIDPVNDLGLATVGVMKVEYWIRNRDLEDLKLSTYALGQGLTAPNSLAFFPSYPSPSQTSGTSATYLTVLGQDFANHFRFQFGRADSNYQSIADKLGPEIVKPLVTSVVMPVVMPLLGGFVDPLLGELGLGTGRASLSVQAVGAGVAAPPIANPDFANTAVGTPVIVAVLNDDAFAPGDTLTVGAVTQGANGTVVINPDGTVTYTPNAGFVGTDTFTYTATNGTLTGNAATVTVNVLPPGRHVPIEVDDLYTTPTGTSLTVPAPGVLGNDVGSPGTTLTAAVVGFPANGTLTLNSDGSFSYFPNPGFVGTDTFTYRTSDGTFASQIATVTINVLPVAPQVVEVQRFGLGAQPTELVLSFSVALDPASAGNLRNYSLAMIVPGRRRIRLRPIRLVSAIYTPSDGKVTLRPARPLPLRRRYLLTVNGTPPTGLASDSGAFLAGQGSGRPGTSFRRVIGRKDLAGPSRPVGRPRNRARTNAALARRGAPTSPAHAPGGALTARAVDAVLGSIARGARPARG